LQRSLPSGQVWRGIRYGNVGNLLHSRTTSTVFRSSLQVTAIPPINQSSPNHGLALSRMLKLNLSFFTDTYAIGKGDEFDGFGLLLGTMLTVRFTQSSVSSLLFLLEPSSPRYLYAHCEGFLPSYSLLFFWAVEWWSYVLLWHIFLPSFVLFLAYTHSTANWLQQMT